VQVRRQAGGAILAEHVRPPAVALDRAAQEVREPPACLGLAAGHRLVDLLTQAELRELRDRAVRTRAAQRARGAEHVAARLLHPAAVVGGEHDVVADVAGHRQPGAGVHAEAEPAQPGRALAGERADVGAQIHVRGARLLREPRELALGRAAPHDQAPVEGAVQVLQALEHELGARAGGVAAVQQAVVEAEERHDLAVLGERPPEGGVVVDAQVAPEPDDRGHRFGYAGTCSGG
jgi:hypothetical protein